MSVEGKLKALGIELPPFNHAAANYSPVVSSGQLIFTAGQTPKLKGVLQYKGKISNADYEKGVDAARLCTLNCLSIIDTYVGGLDKISKIVKITGFVNSTWDFTKHALVMDGATDLLVSIFGDAGRPARSAVGVYSLPGDATVEVELLVELK